MYFVLLINGDEAGAAAAGPEAMAALMAEVAAFDQGLAAEGRKVARLRLDSPGTARTIRLAKGAKTVMDGPFSDTKEMLGGLWLFEAADMDEAMAVADRLPSVPFASVEVRRVSDGEVARVVEAL